MSTTYRALPGDTFASVSRKVYGSESRAADIADANPGVAEPLTPGTVLFTPPDPSARRQRVPAGTGEDLAVLIEGRVFSGWTSATVARALDAPDTLELLAPFDPADPVLRQSLRPFSYHPADVFVAGEPFFTGTLVGVDPSVGVGQRTVGASCYSLPGVLADSTMPASSYPIEYAGLNLAQIAARVCRPFGLAVVFDVDPGAPFEQVACKPGQRVADFLTGLAQQRGIVIGSTPGGALLFSRSAVTGQPVAVLDEDERPVLSVVPAFSPQQYHSHVTGISPVAVGDAGSQITVTNPLLTGVLRPTTFTVNDAEGGTVTAAVRAKAGRMFANMVSYTVGLSTWRTPGGELWRPNTTVRLRAPGAMVYSSYEFEIRSVRFTRTESSETAELNLILPGSYAGAIPEALPWDG